MILNNKDKEHLRKLIEEKVIDVPRGKKIKIDKDLLENLLFQNEKSKNNKVGKFIVWSGDFLNKIDLSDIEFDDVVWDLNFCVKYPNIFTNNPYKNIKTINLSYTNALINFKNSFYQKNLNNNDDTIINCNFENLEMGCFGINLLNNISRCNLRNCNIKFKNNENNKFDKKIDFSNLEGNDLSEVFLNVENIFDYNQSFYIYDCNLKNTNINIIYNYHRPNNYNENLMKYNDLKKKLSKNNNENEKFKQLEEELSKYIKLDEYAIKLGIMIKKQLLDGCYVNRHLILNSEQKRINKHSLIRFYKKEKEKFINSLEENIDKQIKVLMRKQN